MKTLRMIRMGLILLATVTSSTSCSNEYDDSLLTGRVDNLENRVNKLEELCSQMNTNISSLQTIINALQERDYITNVTPITKEDKTIGYTITFAKSNPITIYHGKDGKNGTNGTDGKDGVNGADGKDGITPIIGIKKHTDGIYYWTINNEWLLDENGNKIKAEGTDGKDGINGTDGKDGTNGVDGKDGINGTDGKDGTNGADGKDGITPKLKIEENYWYVSYDNGSTWTLLGKATGENGTNGNDGQDGDNMFDNITVNDDNVTFILKNGVQFSVPIYNPSHLTIELLEVGTLKKVLTAEQKRDLISLTVIGKINQEDINTIEYQLQNLESLDLSKSYYINESLSFDRNDIINGKLTKLLLPNPTPQNNRQQGTKMIINLKQYKYLETIIIPSDTIVTNIIAGSSSNGPFSIDSLLVNEGVTVAYERSCYANVPHVVLPSTIKQIHSLAFGWGTDEQYIGLKTLTCKAITPPAIGNWNYKDNTKYFVDYIESSFYSGNDWHHASECTLIVPAESVELYKQTKFWNNFGNILPMTE